MATIELRVFGNLKKLFTQRNWPFPYNLDIAEEMSARDLAQTLHIPLEGIETVFVNGLAQGLDCTISPGDRVALVPPGTPGPYRVILGFVQRNKGTKP